MGRIGLPELVIILVIIVLIFAPTACPRLGAASAKGIKNFKEATNKGANDDNA